MKKKIYIIAALLLAVTLNAAVRTVPQKKAAKPRGPIATLWAVGEMYMPQDSAYKDLYGNSMILPKLKLNVHLGKNIDLFAGVSFSKRTGNLDQYGLKIDMESKQTLISFGAGWHAPLSDKLDWYAELGGLIVKAQETGMEESVKESLVGLCAELGLKYRLAKSIFAQVHAAYLQTQEKEIGPLSLKAGGIAFGAGLGFQF